MKIGSLFSGYGGLDMGVMSVLGGEVAWHVEFDEAPSRILAHHWPDVPNYGDVTNVDWSAVPPVDVLTGGFPCQDVSLAGARAGLKDGTRSGLWSEFARAIDVLRPSLVVIENVRGLLSAAADSDMEPCTWCVGDEPDEPVLRALGAVLGDLADLGYDTRWVGVHASDAGAPHGRFRVFVVAQDTHLATRDQRRLAAPRQAESGRARANAGGRGGTSLANSSGHKSERWGVDQLVARSSRTGEVDSEQRERDGDAAGDCSGFAPDTAGGGRDGRAQDTLGESVGRAPSAGGGGVPEWDKYEPAIRRWEHVTGRMAPAPALPTGRNGDARLSAAFVEWMMGLPEGHVTDVGLTRAQQLKALGNGVVPQQAALALTLLGAVA